MNVRWITSRQPDGNGRRHRALSAVLVEETSPAPGGRPPEPLCLGAIEERFLTVNVPRLRAFHQGLFWTSVDRRLGELALDAEGRRRIESELSARVPRPPEDWALWGVVCVPQYD